MKDKFESLAVAVLTRAFMDLHADSAKAERAWWWLAGRGSGWLDVLDFAHPDQVNQALDAALPALWVKRMFRARQRRNDPPDICQTLAAMIMPPIYLSQEKENV